MDTAEIRRRFLAHFEANGHTVVPSAPLLLDDPNLLFVNAGTENVPEACMFDALWDVDASGNFIPNLAVEVPTPANGGISHSEGHGHGMFFAAYFNDRARFDRIRNWTRLNLSRPRDALLA